MERERPAVDFESYAGDSKKVEKFDVSANEQELIIDRMQKVREFAEITDTMMQNPTHINTHITYNQTIDAELTKHEKQLHSILASVKHLHTFFDQANENCSDTFLVLNDDVNALFRDVRDLRRFIHNTSSAFDS
jgi:hypothetical protein